MDICDGGSSSRRDASHVEHQPRGASYAWLLKVVAIGGMALGICAGSADAQAETISPRRLLEVVDLAGPTISPDGRAVAFRAEQASIERNTYDTVWYVQDMNAKSPPRRVADGGIPLRDSAGVPVQPSVQWSPDGRWIYYRALVDGRIDVWCAAVDGSGTHPLTLDAADVRDFTVNDEGRTLMYSVGATREEVANAEQSEYEHGVHIDESVPIGQGLFRSGNIEGRLATQRYQGVWFGRAGLLAGVPDSWKAVDLASGKIRSARPSEIPARAFSASDLAKELPSPWRLATDPRTGRIALLTRVGETAGLRDKPDVQLAMLPEKRSIAPIRCTAAQCTQQAITGVQWRPGKDEVVFTVTDPKQGMAQSISRWNVRSGVVRPVTRSPGLLSGSRDPSSACGISASALVCVAAEADQPPHLKRIDLETGQAHVLFEPNTALARDIQAMAPSRLLRWTDAKGHEFTGRFFPALHARGAAPPPLFVTYYSCTGFLRGGLGDEWPLPSLAEEGISSLCINQAPYRLDAVERYDLGLSAVASVVERLAQAGEIDRTRIGMGGLSFGSEVTLWTAMKSPLLTAISVTSPVISPNYYLFSSLKSESFLRSLKELWQLGSPDETPERWQELSPTFNLGRIRAPALYQMPEQEYIYALDYVVSLMREHRADLYVFPHEPHQKFQPRHKLAAYERNLDWFRFWLQGHEDPNPSKAGQYSHWRQMRAASVEDGSL